MYACTIQDDDTMLRTTFVCGCYDIILELTRMASCKECRISTSAIREITLSQAEQISCNRLPNETELIERAARALAEWLEGFS